MDRKELLETNQRAWDKQAQSGCRWSQPVSADGIAQARKGDLRIVLTPQKIVPQGWFGDLDGCHTLMLASGGGQQSPLLAAAGAKVTVLDLSSEQLQRDREVAQREDLELTTVQGSMDDLSAFDDASFDMIINPCSNSFAPQLRPVWNECARVLRIGGTLMVGFCNPLIYLFEMDALEQGRLDVAHRLPYSDTESLARPQLEKLLDSGEPLMHGHTLQEQIGDLLEAGFVMCDLFEDEWGESGDGGYQLLDQYTPSFVAMRLRREAR